MHVVEVFLPVYDRRHRRFAKNKFDRVRDELADRFGGVTAFRRAPAEGLWRTRRGRVHDEIVVYEVMVERLSVRWWKRYRGELEDRFDQDRILMRAHALRIL